MDWGINAFSSQEEQGLHPLWQGNSYAHRVTFQGISVEILILRAKVL